MSETQIAKPESVEKSAPARGLKQFPRYSKAALGLRNYWYPAVLARRLKKKPLPIKMLGEELVLVRHDGKVFCIQGRCVHRGVPLCEGKFDFPGSITCPYHGWTYELATGRCVAALTDGPESAVVGKVKLRTYPAQERQGVVWVFVGDGEAPRLEQDVYPAFLEQGALVGARVFEWRGNWRIAMEGAIDPSHPFYLHRMSWLAQPYSFIASRGRHWPEIVDNRYLTYRTDPPIPESEYPGLGRWPRRAWWRRKHLNKLLVYGALPCSSMVENLNFNMPFVTYSWYVPIDESHYRWFTFLVAPAKISGVRRWAAWLKYWLWLRWMYQGEFLRQDSWMSEIMHPFYDEQDGWSKERLYRPDVVLTAWRRFIEKEARDIQEYSR